MRIRQVKPAFWSDPTIAALSEATRLFYVGLWMVADDAGWLRWDAAEIGHELYGYENRGRRERRVTAMLLELVGSGRVVEHSCGHLEIPTLVEHQRLAGTTKQVRTIFNDHLRLCVSATPRNSPQLPAGDRESPSLARDAMVRNGQERERSGTERNGTVSAQPRDEMNRETTESEFRRLAGLPAVMGGKPS